MFSKSSKLSNYLNIKKIRECSEQERLYIAKKLSELTKSDWTYNQKEQCFEFIEPNKEPGEWSYAVYNGGFVIDTLCHPTDFKLQINKCNRVWECALSEAGLKNFPPNLRKP